jgi:transcription-repair coupling factor (superfamily II helicase)
MALSLSRLRIGSAVVAVTAGPVELEALYADLQTLGGHAGTLLFPAAEGGAGESSADPELDGARLAVLRSLRRPADETPADAAPPVLATSRQALEQTVPDPDALRQATRHLAVNREQAFGSLVEALATAGYRRAAEVTAKGEMAVRGGILDVWPLTLPLPVRAEFAGDRVESLRSFDPASQRSVERLEETWLPPAAPASLPGTTLAACLPGGTAVLWLDAGGLETPSSSLEGCRPALEIFSGDPPPAGVPSMDLDVAALAGLPDLGDDPLHPDVLAETRRRLLDRWTAEATGGGCVAVLLDTAGACEWLRRELGPDTALAVIHGALSGGFVLAARRLTVVAQPDLYAVRKRAGRRVAPESVAARGGRIEIAAELTPGELVVHLDHGIGRYLGTTEVDLDGRRSEVFTVEYAEGARLHVPVAHAHLLSRYMGVGGREAALHRLGGRRWTRERADAERAIVDLASSLLETQARRDARPGIPFDVDPPWMHAFEAAFPYPETPDQTRVIAEVKRDLAAARPMDRLICGDAGYGKTEIAMRAAFVAVMNGRQVAVLVPTTVLAEQHYETFRERFGAYPVRIEVLSRFRTAAQRAAVLAEMAAGRVDIVIGTHALLQPQIAFKDLGLVVIDEEQRFGVVHKERLKQVRALVDVLTLTATPIPRTLYLGLTGARDLSLLQTPPQERLAIETRAVRDSDAVIRSAILQELGREGQVFFLYNRVLTIGIMHERLRRLVPEARIVVGHGQMPSHELARVMRAFERGEADVLLSTTIVENGLDIPRANTILIHRADRFGIADLYQLRGRVGRSAHKGYAYLLLPPQGVVDSEARQRVGALQRHAGLGAGFPLALRDLELRGAGNILGAAQSGHIAAIGFGLYCQLLRRTVARLKGQEAPPLVDVELALDFLDLSPAADSGAGAALPYSYVEEEAQRHALHRRLGEAATVPEVRALRDEIADRYGRPPAPAARLLRLAELRIVAAGRNVRRIETRGDQVRLFRRRDPQPLTRNGLLPRLPAGRPDQRLSALFRLVATLA